MAVRESLKILFVCSMNQWRSPTAERIYADNPHVIARSCGTSRKAKKTISAADLKWADTILVMETKHRNRLLSEFPWEMRFKEIHILDIPDNYRLMDPELVEEIKAMVEPILAGRENTG